jgi:hypothetical protein
MTDWQGHSWAYRRDAKREYGQGGGELVAPGSPEPIAVRISAERGDMRATRQITLTADDAAKHRQGQARAVENLRAQYDPKIAQYQNQVANTATALADKQALLKKAVDNPRYVYGANNQKRQDYRPIYDLKLEVSNAKYSQRRLTEINIPFLQADLRGRVAFESGQWQAAYTAFSNALDLQRAAIALNNERLADVATIQDWYFSQPAPRDEDAAGIADMRKRAVAARPGNARGALRQSLEERKPIVPMLFHSAKWTGQMENVKKALAEKQELADGYAAIAVVDAEKPEVQARQRQEQQAKAREARLTQRANLREEAEATALLTGDRTKAAALYAQGMDLYADEFNESWFGQPAKPWRDNTSFPAWWPESGEGGKPASRP